MATGNWCRASGVTEIHTRRSPNDYLWRQRRTSWGHSPVGAAEGQPTNLRSVRVVLIFCSLSFCHNQSHFGCKVWARYAYIEFLFSTVNSFCRYNIHHLSLEIRRHYTLAFQRLHHPRMKRETEIYSERQGGCRRRVVLNYQNHNNNERALIQGTPVFFCIFSSKDMATHQRSP